MARSAKLISIDAVRDMAVALSTFGDEALGALDELDINVRRALEWIGHDRKDFWGHEVRRGWEHVGEARAELEKALTYRKVADQAPSCRQERALLDKAKHRVQTAEEKNHSLPRWAHAVEHGVRDLQGNQSQLLDWLRGELPRALSVLRQITTTLERYAAVQGGVPQERTAARSGETDEVDERVPETTETKESDYEDLGSAHPGGETPPGDEGPASGPG